MDRVKKTPRIYKPASDMRGLLSNLSEHGDKIVYRYYSDPKTISDMTYTEYVNTVRRIAAGFDKLALTGKRIAVIGDTSPFWVASYMAAIASGSVAVPMDKELMVDEIEGLLASADVEAIVFSRAFNTKFANAMATHTTLKYFIPMEPGDLTGDNIVSLEALMNMGDTAYEYPVTEDTNRMAEMLFTSGTTGTAKCVMLSEKNILTAVNSACETVNFNPDDTIVSVLPVHHTYELACMQAGMNYGMTIGINDAIKHALKNFKTFAPTGLVLVPLFVNTIYKRIFDEARKSGREKKLRFGIKLSRFLRKFGVDVRKKLFRDVREAFGGRIYKIVCGGAPLNPEMCRTFFEFGIQISEGYGITECSPLISVNPYFEPHAGSVGPAVPGCQARIERDGEILPVGEVGEIVVTGGNVMLGYYNNEEANKAVFTEDGWFRTGDMGYMDKKGYIYITGRIKSVIVLENGKNVFPEEIEEYLSEIPGIAESVVVGRHAEDGETVVLTAVIFPDRETQFAGMDDAAIKTALEANISDLNKRLAGFKQIRAIELRAEEFEKTTSRKIRRHLVK